MVCIPWCLSLSARARKPGWSSCPRPGLGETETMALPCSCGPVLFPQLPGSCHGTPISSMWSVSLACVEAVQLVHRCLSRTILTTGEYFEVFLERGKLSIHLHTILGLPLRLESFLFAFYLLILRTSNTQIRDSHYFIIQVLFC